MKLEIDVITIFPEFFEKPIQFGPIKRARDAGVLEIKLLNLREFAPTPKEVDDYPFGGGSGMILKPEPIKKAIDSVKKEGGTVVLLSPQGVTFNQKLARRLAEESQIILICGRYKGVDERIMKYVDMELSIGDYVLSGGEPAALVVIDAVSRLLPGALGSEDSAETDSFEWGILDAPYYTRPRVFDGMEVPEVLLSGDHARIERWRRKEALRRTLKKRPDLLDKVLLDKKDLELLEEIKKEEGL
mgnify:CR=1 FL=1